MLELLCISDLHFGEDYTFLDFPSQWNWDNQKGLQPFYEEVAKLADLKPDSEPEVKVNSLVLLGDIFELATAKIKRAAKSGRNFYDWLFQWLHPARVVYVPGNHDHVFWMWWLVEPEPGKDNWWRRNPDKVKDKLSEAYKKLKAKTCEPWSPVGVDGNSWREELIRYFFGTKARTLPFSLAYPAYWGPTCGPPGYRDRPFRSIFTHGHLNDPTFVRPHESGFIGRAMNWLVKGREKPVNLEDLNHMEKDTWEFTNKFWYPHTTNVTLGETLYLAALKFEHNNPCRHQARYQERYVRELAPDLKEVDGSFNDYYNFLLAALGERWYETPYAYVYGHTHRGGALPLDPTLLLYNTGGWLSIVNDNPIHTHIFAITSEGTAKMVRVDFS